MADRMVSVSLYTYLRDGSHGGQISLELTPAEAQLFMSQKGEIIDLDGRDFRLSSATLSLTHSGPVPEIPTFHVAAEGMYRT